MLICPYESEVFLACLALILREESTALEASIDFFNNDYRKRFAHS